MAATALAGPARAATPQYKLVLNPVANTDYLGINNNGDILGSASENGFVTPAPFRAGSTTPQFLNPPNGEPSEFETVAGFNNADQVVGAYALGSSIAELWPNSSTPTNLSQQERQGHRSRLRRT